MKLSKRQDLVTSFWKNVDDWDSSGSDIWQQVNRVLVNDTLKLRCRIWVKHSVEHNISSTFGLNSEGNKDAKLRRFEKLACDLQMEKTYTDVSLVTKTSTLRANKFILAARSPVFRTMFQSPLLYSRNGNTTGETKVKIDDFDAEDVASMLEYMYTGATPIKTEKALELLKVADFYGLDELKEDCLNVILANDLTVETAVATLALAHLHDYSKLKTKVFSFINRNKKEIFQSDEFKEFAKKNPEVLFELCSF